LFLSTKDRSAKEGMNKQQLAAKIWETANKMRSKIEAGEYKDFILGFMFYKFISDKELKFLRAKEYTEDEIENLTEDDHRSVKYVQNNIGFFLPYKDLFSTWISKGADFDVSDVMDALSAFDRLVNPSHKRVFDGVFKTLRSGINKLGGTAAEQTKAIRDLLHLLKIIPMNGKQNYDVLGYIYEFLISNFAANAGKKAGEFYTPHEVSVLMSEIVSNHLNGKEDIMIYDPTSGSGSLLINIGSTVSKHISDKDRIKYYAQELKENTYNLTRMNLVMRGILPNNIIVRNNDTLEADWPYFDESDPQGTYNPLFVDAVISNPPYSQHWNKENKESDPRFSEFGLAPSSKADYAFLLHCLYHIKPDGIMTIILPHGVLFRTGEEETIRKNLIEKNHIDVIIGLPSNIFFGTGIPTIIMVLKKDNKKNNDILIIDASKGYVKDGNKNILRASDIKKITDTITKRESILKYSRAVSIEEIRNNNYNLNIPRYVDSSDPQETWDIYSLMFGGIPKYELSRLDRHWEAFPNLYHELFDELNSSYVYIKTTDIKGVIENNNDIHSYLERYKGSFIDFESFLKKRLIDNLMNVVISREQDEISQEIFSRLEPYKLLDKYKAYQALDDIWVNTSLDLETIHSEGFESVKRVDPNIVIKKKDNKDEEVQDGWIGRVIPFEIAQNEIFRSELESLENRKNHLNEVLAEQQELYDCLTGDDQVQRAQKDNDDSFASIVRGLIHELDDDPSGGDESIKPKLLKYVHLLDEGRKLNREINKDAIDLHNKTKETIESLSDDMATVLLIRKWIHPLVDSISKLPCSIISDISSKVKYLEEKYKTTCSDITKEIKDNQKSLLTLIDDLVGDEYDMKGLSELKSLLNGD
jgi:type I restriction enzyme M protein